MRRIRACGSGTEIGKTHVGCALSKELRSRGIEVAARKPVESGYSEDDPTTTDAHRLAPGLCNLGLVAAAEPDAVVPVAPDRLGALHDTTAASLALEAWQVRELTVVVLSAPPEANTATGTNARELATLGIVDGVIVFPRAAAEDARRRDELPPSWLT